MTSRRRARAWTIAVGVVIAALAAAGLAVHHYSSPAYLESRLERALGPAHRIEIESSGYNPLTNTFHAAGVTIAPDSAAGPGAERHRTRTWFQLPAVRVSGVDLWALRKGNLVAGEIQVERPGIRIVLDRRVPAKHRGRTRRMPHEILASSSRNISIGKIRLVDGEINFSEWSLTGSRPGSIRFADFFATVHNVRSDGGAGEQPCEIDVRTRLADDGLLQARFDYHLASDTLKLDYRATMGRMNAGSFNDLLVNLKGIRVTGGVIDSLTADIQMRGHVATGTVRLPYHGFDFEVLDKESLEQDLGDELATWLYSSKASESNLDDDEPVPVVEVRCLRRRDEALIKFVWEAVRQGVLKSTGLE